MYHIIINPASRSGKGIRLWKETVEPILHKENIAYRSYFSEKAGDVTRIASEISSAAKEPYHLIILGGDGTVNEALQGLENRALATIGYIPTGSSNDFARDMGIPKDAAAALKLILHTGKAHTMDIGSLSFDDGKPHLFAVSCGIGFDAAVCEESARSKIKTVLNRIGLGKLTYLGIALKQLFSAKKVACTLTVDDHAPIHIQKVLFITGMIHRYEGGGFKFCPDADASDGLLNICAVGDVPKLLVLFALPTAYWGKHYFVKGIQPYKASRIKIDTTSPLWVHTDGEVLQKTHSLTVTCLHNAIKIIGN